MKSFPKLLPYLLSWALLGAVTAPAQTLFTWTNVLNGFWTNAANWTPGVPTSTNTNTVLQFTNGGGILRTTNNFTNSFTNAFRMHRLQFTGAANSTTFLSGNALHFFRSNTALPSIVNDGDGVVVVSNAITLTTNLTLQGNGLGSMVFAGVISGVSVSLTNNSAGTVFLRANNTFGGAGRSVTINRGILNVDSNNRLGNTGNALIISSNAVLQLTNSFTHTRAITLGTGGGVIDVAGVNSVITQDAAVNGNVAFTKTGAGTIVFNTATARTGTNRIEGGLVQLNLFNGLGTNSFFLAGGQLAIAQIGFFPNNVVLAGGTLGGTVGANGSNRIFTGSINVLSNSSISTTDARIASTNIDLYLRGVVSGTGNVQIAGSPLPSFVMLTNNLNTHSGTWFVGSNVNLISAHSNGSSFGSASYVLSNLSTLSFRLGGTNTNRVDAFTNFFLSNAISVVDGTATLDARRPANNGGVQTNRVVLNTLVLSNGIAAATFANAYSIGFTGPVSVAGASGFSPVGGTLAIDGPITETTPGSSIVKRGGGILTFTNFFENNWTGGTEMQAGTWNVNVGTNPASLLLVTNPLGTGPITLTGGTLNFRGDASQTVGPGAGYNVTAGFSTNSVGTLVVQALTGAGVNRTISFNQLTLGTNAFRSDTTNGYTLRFVGPTTLTTNSAIIDNLANLSLAGPVLAPSNAVVLKRGGGRLFLTSFTSNAWGGGTIIEAGQLQIAADNGLADNFALGTGPVTLRGGTLELRHDVATGVRQRFGQGLGYQVNVIGNSTINADRISAGSDGIAQLGKLIHTNNAVLSISSGNTHSLEFLDAPEIAGNARFNVSAGGSGTRFGAEFRAGVTGAGILVKTNTGRLGYMGDTNPAFAGQLSVEQGLFAWRPTNSWATSGGNYGFGNGPVLLNGSGQFAMFLSTTATNNFTNSFRVLSSLARGGLTNDGGGVLSLARTAASPQIRFTGPVLLGGNLTLGYTNGGNLASVVVAGPVTVHGEDRILRTVKQGADTATQDRVQVSGNISDDGIPRTLRLVANNRGVIELSGNNSGIQNFLVTGSEYANAGRVAFANAQALPANRVTVTDGGFVGLNFDPRSAGFANLAALGSKFTFQSGSLLALDSTTNDAFVLNLGASGLNQDVRIGVSVGVTRTNSQLITPFGNTYKLSGGGGTLVLSGVNQLTGNNDLNIGSERFAVPIGHASAGGTLNMNASNNFVGDTLINPGATVVLNTGATNRPLGFGAVDVYGVLQAGGNRAGFAAAGGESNVYQINLRPGSALNLDHRNTGLNSDRWADAQPLDLSGASLRLYGVATNNTVLNEAIGTVNVALGAGIIIDGEATALTQLTVSNLNRIGAGTLQLQRDTGLGAISELGVSNRMVVINSPLATNGIVSPWMMNGTDHRHLNYNPSAGFVDATYSLNTLDSATLGTELVDQQTPVTLTGDRSLHALRFSGAIFSNAAADTITINSGSLAASGNAAMNAIVDFAGQEGFVYVGTGTLSNNAAMANASTITKFGDGTLRLAAGAPTYANGWNVNRGSVTLVGGAGTFTNGATNFALGATVAGNFLNLNGNDVTLNLSSVGTNLVYSSGLIRVKDQAVLVNDSQIGTNRQFFAPHGLEFSTENNGPLGALLRVDIARNRSELEAIGQTRLLADTTLNVRNTGGASSNTGGTNRLILAGGLAGTNVVLTKTGNGILELPGNNSATVINGTIRVLGGTLSVGSSGSLGNAGTSLTVASNAVLELNSGTVGFNPVAAVNQSGGSAERWLGPSGRFANSGAIETISIATNVDLQLAYQTTNANMSAKTVRMNGGAFGGYQFIDDNRGLFITNNFNFELAANSKIGQSAVDIGRANLTTRFNGAISEIGGPRSLTKVGLDTVVLGGSSSFSGGTTVRAGTLRMGIANALNPLGSMTVEDQAVLDLAGFNLGVRNLSGAGMLTNSAVSTITLTTFHTTSNEFSGAIGGPMILVKQGAGALRLSGLNTSVGARQIDNGALVLGANSANNAGPLGGSNSTVVINDPGLGASSSLIAAGAYNVPQEISIIGDTGGQKIVGSTGANAASFTGNLLLVGGLTVTADTGGSASFSGTVFESGSRNLVKQGGGTVALNGNGTISGSMVLSNGTLLVNNTLVGNAAANHYIEAATLGGNGRVIGGSTFVGFDPGFAEYSARIAPGNNAAGALTVDGDVFFSTIAKLSLEIGGLIATNQYDRFNIGGTAFFDGQLELALINGYFPATNSLFDLVRYGGDSGQRFANAANGSRLNTSDNLGSFRVNYSSTNLFVDQFQFVDSDLDGIFDAWALKYFNLLNLAAGTGPTQRFGDFDGDGQNNFQEFMAGTIPTNSTSALAIRTVVVSGSANLALQWDEAEELAFRTPVYRIQHTTNFTTWQTVTNPVLSQPVPGTWQWIDNGTQTGGTAPLNLPTTRAYRVQVQ